MYNRQIPRLLQSRRLARREATSLLCGGIAVRSLSGQQNRPFRIAVAGLQHGHAKSLFGRNLKRPDVQLVGVSERDVDLRKQYMDQFQLDPKLLFDSLSAMLDQSQPEGVLIYSNTFEHLATMAACTARGVPVMMEKPFAVSLDHARQMEALSRKHNVAVFVNYIIPSWPSNYAAWSLARLGKLGDLRKIVVHDGHQGPLEVSTSGILSPWIGDPVLSGGGALFDMGCYGANLITWLMNDERPLSVSAILQQIKPEVYPRVDDEATIVLRYPKAQGIIQASWNWPFDRKDMEVYGKTGYAIAKHARELHVRFAGQEEEVVTPSPVEQPVDGLSYFIKVANGRLEPSGPAALKNNMIVAEILEAAKRSSQTNRTVELS